MANELLPFGGAHPTYEEILYGLAGHGAMDGAPSLRYGGTMQPSPVPPQLGVPQQAPPSLGNFLENLLQQRPVMPYKQMEMIPGSESSWIDRLPDANYDPEGGEHRPQVMNRLAPMLHMNPEEGDSWWGRYHNMQDGQVQPARYDQGGERSEEEERWIRRLRGEETLPQDQSGPPDERLVRRYRMYPTGGIRG